MANIILYYVGIFIVVAVAASALTGNLTGKSSFKIKRTLQGLIMPFMITWLLTPVFLAYAPNWQDAVFVISWILFTALCMKNMKDE